MAHPGACGAPSTPRIPWQIRRRSSDLPRTSRQRSSSWRIRAGRSRFATFAGRRGPGSGRSGTRRQLSEGSSRPAVTCRGVWPRPGPPGLSNEGRCIACCRVCYAVGRPVLEPLGARTRGRAVVRPRRRGQSPVGGRDLGPGTGARRPSRRDDRRARRTVARGGHGASCRRARRPRRPYPRRAPGHGARADC